MGTSLHLVGTNSLDMMVDTIITTIFQSQCVVVGWYSVVDLTVEEGVESRWNTELQNIIKYFSNF